MLTAAFLETALQDALSGIPPLPVMLVLMTVLLEAAVGRTIRDIELVHWPSKI